MKKLLLGSTALVAGGVMAAPAMAADPIKMGIGGYYTFYALAGNINSSYAFDGSFTTYKGLAFTQEGEIHFIGQTKLDNGTSVGLTVELEAWNPGIGVVGGGTAGSNIHDRRSLHLRLRRLGPHRAGLARRRVVPYVLRHAVGPDRLGCHPAQPQLGQRLGHREQQGLRPDDGDDHHADLAGREPHQLLHAALRRPADRCRLRAQDHRRCRQRPGFRRSAQRCRQLRLRRRHQHQQLPERRLCLAGCVRRRCQLPEQVRRLHRRSVRCVRLRHVRARLPAAGRRGQHGDRCQPHQLEAVGARCSVRLRRLHRRRRGRLGQQRRRCELLHRRRQRHPLLYRGHHVRDRSVADVVHVGRLLQHQRQRQQQHAVDRAGHQPRDADHLRWRAGRQQHLLQW